MSTWVSTKYASQLFARLKAHLILVNVCPWTYAIHFYFLQNKLKFFVFWTTYWTKNGWALFLTSNWDRIQREKLYKCSAASFAKKAHLNVHIATVDEEKKDFMSNVCDANFSFRKFLKNHLASIHYGKKLNCDLMLAFHQRQTWIDT